MCNPFCKLFIFCIYGGLLISSSYFIIDSSLCTPFYFPDDSIFKNDKILFDLNYSNISSFPYLEQMYKNYSNNIYYQIKYDLNFSVIFALLPIFVILTFILSANFIFCINYKSYFYFFGMLTFLMQVLLLVNKIYSNLYKENLPKFENYNNTFPEIFKEYNDYKYVDENDIYTIIIVLLSIQFVIFLCLVIFIRKQQDNKYNNNCTIIFHTIFGFASTCVFAFSFYFYYPCKNRYSGNFLPDKYCFSKILETNSTQIYNNKNEYIIEEYNYDSYPFLKEIYESYYFNSSSNEVKKFKLDLDNLGIIYFILAMIVMPALALISFILLVLSKCKNKCSKGFVVSEIFSFELKLGIIIWPFIELKMKYNKKIDNSNEEIQYIIDDYINYSKCRNEIPIILMIESIYICFEIITFFATFCGDKEDKKNNEIKEIIKDINSIKEPLFKEEKKEEIKEPENNSRIIVIQRDRIITREVEHQFVNLKFKDNKNNTYELEVDSKRRFNDVLNELIGKYDYLRKNEIRSVIYNNRYLYLTSRRCFETIEELRIDENSDSIYIEVEEKQESTVINNSQAINEEEENNINNESPSVPKLKFCIINLDSRKVEIERNENIPFSNLLENLKKKDKEFENLNFESIFYYDRGEKKHIKEEDMNKKINELEIPEDEVIFIKTVIKDNTPINITFVCVTGYIRRYNFTAGKKENFHSVAIEFMSTCEEMVDNTITRFFYKKQNINQNDEIIDINENQNMINPVEEDSQLVQIESELNLNFQLLKI